jgi:Hint domain
MQFMSADPLVDQTGQPYGYAADNPLNMTDLTGLRGCSIGPFTLPWGQAGSTCTAQLHAQLQTWVGTDSVGNGPLNRLAQYTGASGRAYALAHPDTYAGPLGRLASGTAGDAHAAIAATPWLNDALHAPLQPCANAWVPQVIDAALLASALFDPATGLLTGAMRGAEVVERVGPVADSLEGRAGWTDDTAAVQPQAPESQSAQSGAARGLDRPGCTGCFPAGTPVATPKGLRPIQTLHVGDKVLAEDPKTHKVEAEPQQAVEHNPAAPLMAIDLSDGSTITATLTHAFWVDAGVGLAQAGWLYAEHASGRPAAHG